MGGRRSLYRSASLSLDGIGRFFDALPRAEFHNSVIPVYYLVGTKFTRPSVERLSRTASRRILVVHPFSFDMFGSLCDTSLRSGT